MESRLLPSPLASALGDSTDNRERFFRELSEAKLSACGVRFGVRGTGGVNA